MDHTEYGGYGGGIAVLGSMAAQVTNCTIYDCSSENKGGGVYVDKDGAVSFINCTLSGNHADEGSGLCLADAGQVTLVNTLIAFGDPGAAFSGTGNVDITNSNVFGNQGGDWTGPIAGQLGSNGNISMDPLFVDKEKGDLHLCFGSPCRDSGNGNIPGLPEKDLEGDPRIAYGFVDMGADEFHTHPYCTRDAFPNGEMEVKIIGMPERTILLCLGMDLLNPPLKTKFGDWYLQNSYPPVTLGQTSWKGLMTLKVRIPPFYPVPSTVYLQSFVRDELTNPWVMEIR